MDDARWKGLHLVSQHGSGNDVSYGEDVARGGLRPEVLIHLDPAPVVQLDAHFVESQPMAQEWPST